MGRTCASRNPSRSRSGKANKETRRIKKKPVAKHAQKPTPHHSICGICSRQFKSTSELVAHRCARVDAKHSCPNCWKRFCWMVERNEHEKTCHKKVKKPRIYALRTAIDVEEPEETPMDEVAHEHPPEEEQRPARLSTSFRMDKNGHLIHSTHKDTQEAVAEAPFQSLDECREEQLMRLKDVTLKDSEIPRHGSSDTNFEEFFNMDYQLLTEMTDLATDGTTIYAPIGTCSGLDEIRLRLEEVERRAAARIEEVEKRLALVESELEQVKMAPPKFINPPTRKRASAIRPLPFTRGRN